MKKPKPRSALGNRRPPISLNDYDFSYVRNLPDHLQRMAAFWEYARESKAVKQLCRDYVKWSNEWTPESGREFIVKGNPKLLADEAVMLWQSSLNGHFPKRSFKEMLNTHLLPKPFETDRRFQMGVGHGGLDVFSLALLQPIDLATLHPLWDYYAVAIDWTYSNRQLAEWFAERLKKLRPADRLEPRARPGRHGRSSHAAPTDMLNQLAAFRLSRAGLTVSAAKKNCGRGIIYEPGSPGWDKAVRAAQTRIDQMLKGPFFSAVRFRPRNK